MTQRAIDGNFVYFVTANVKDRRWYFVLPELANKLGQAIQTCCHMKRFELLAYCILPNHIHLLVRKLQLGETETQCTLESARWGGTMSESEYLFPYRRLSVRQCGPDQRFLPIPPHRRLSSRRCASDQRYSLSNLMQSIKGSFSRTLPLGTFWQHRSYFRVIDSTECLRNVVSYIRFNYRKMDLPRRCGQSPFVFFNHYALVKLF
jgi:hypothetical protein